MRGIAKRGNKKGKEPTDDEQKISSMNYTNNYGREETGNRFHSSHTHTHTHHTQANQRSPEVSGAAALLPPASNHCSNATDGSSEAAGVMRWWFG